MPTVSPVPKHRRVAIGSHGWDGAGGCMRGGGGGSCSGSNSLVMALLYFYNLGLVMLGTPQGFLSIEVMDFDLLRTVARHRWHIKKFFLR